MKYDDETDFEVKVYGSFHVMDISQESANEYIENELYSRNYLNDLSIGNWYEIELEDNNYILVRESEVEIVST